MDNWKAKKAKYEKIVLFATGLGLFLLGGAGILLQGHDVILMGGLMMLGCTLFGYGYIKNEEFKLQKNAIEGEDDDQESLSEEK